MAARLHGVGRTGWRDSIHGKRDNGVCKSLLGRQAFPAGTHRRVKTMAADDAAAGYVLLWHWHGETANSLDYVAAKADQRDHRILGADQRVYMV